MFHGQSQIDFSGFPTTLAIIGAITLIVLVAKTIFKMFPAVKDKMDDALEMLEWSGVNPEDVDEHPANRTTSRFDQYV